MTGPLQHCHIWVPMKSTVTANGSITSFCSFLEERGNVIPMALNPASFSTVNKVSHAEKPSTVAYGSLERACVE